MKMMLISLNIILMLVRKKILPRRRKLQLAAAVPSLDLLIHDLHLAHPPTQAQGLGPEESTSAGLKICPQKH
ncbi:Glycine dehydrogenase (decarboxylating) [Varanus komodoensis]|nr:Glycine dehydrogenase (decarboxylating) [Varanus komodoensis]